MTRPTALLLLVPGPWWERDGPRPPFSAAVADAIGCEHRLLRPEPVAADQERARYAVAHRTIETLALAALAEDTEVLGETVPTMPPVEADAATRLRSGLFLPAAHPLVAQAPGLTVTEQLAVLDELVARAAPATRPALEDRRRAFARAAAAGAGIVETVNPFGAGGPAASADLTAADPVPATGWDASTEGADRDAADPPPSEPTAAFLARAGRALAEGRPLAIGQASNEALARGLHALVFAEQPGRIDRPVVYSDGSVGRPFPLRCLPRPLSAALPDLEQPDLRAALMSMRHLHIDPRADIALLRNVDVSRGGALAEADALAERSARRWLRRAEPLTLWLYQTGFQPSVVAFYRLVVEELLGAATGDRPPLAVRPIFFNRHGYRPGPDWYLAGGFG